MIQAVFFDWFNTLAHYSPSREELQRKALGELGIDVSLEKLVPAMQTADKNFFDEYAVSPVTRKSPEEQAKVYYRYQQTVLSEAGVDISGLSDIIPQILKRAQELYKDIRFTLFDDVLPVIKDLKEKGFVLGVVTNMDSDMAPLCRELGLEPYLDVVVTSGEVGSDKPRPEIFIEALNRAGVGAEETMHVGDQYKIDVDGARNAGISPVLLDRFGLYPDVNDCPSVSSLEEIAGFLG